MVWKRKMDERLLTRAADGGLDTVERGQLLRQLAEDAELRHLAVELAFLSHDGDDGPRMDAARAQNQLERLRRLAHEDLARTSPREAHGAFGFGLAPGLAVAAALVILLVFAGKPQAPDVEAPGQAASQALLSRPTATQTVAVPAALPAAPQGESPSQALPLSAPAGVSATASPLSPTAGAPAPLP